MGQRSKTDQERNPDRYFHGPEGHIVDRILIAEDEKLPREGVFISLNGYPYLIKPGFEVDIPRPVRLMLDTRIQRYSVQTEDGKFFHRDVKRINYTLIKADVKNSPDDEQEEDGIDDTPPPSPTRKSSRADDSFPGGD